MQTALTRAVGASIARCELEYLPRIAIDPVRAAAQHCEYELCLERCGLRVVSLPADPQFPDGLFVEDPAIVVDEVAVMCRMGAVSRRGEAPSIAEALAPFRKLAWIREPATIEGGDVMRIGKTIYCGISRRTNREGAQQLANLLEPFGYRVIAVPVTGCLHLKSAICPLDRGAALANRHWIDSNSFRDLRIFEVPEDEPAAANVLRVRDRILMPASFPRTREMLERLEFATVALDISELQKAEAGVTCSSLIFET